MADLYLAAAKDFAQRHVHHPVLVEWDAQLVHQRGAAGLQGLDEFGIPWIRLSPQVLSGEFRLPYKPDVKIGSALDAFCYVTCHEVGHAAHRHGWPLALPPVGGVRPQLAPPPAGSILARMVEDLTAKNEAEAHAWAKAHLGEFKLILDQYLQVEQLVHHYVRQAFARR